MTLSGALAVTLTQNNTNKSSILFHKLLCKSARATNKDIREEMGSQFKKQQGFNKNLSECFRYISEATEAKTIINARKEKHRVNLQSNISNKEEARQQDAATHSLLKFSLLSSRTQKELNDTKNTVLKMK